MNRDQWVAAGVAMVRCDLMFEFWEKHKDELLELYPGLAKGDFRTDNRIIFQRSSSFLIVGVALLYAVIEYLQNHQVLFPESVRADIEILSPKLREFRNCVFHVQDDVLSERQYALLDHDNSLLTIAKIHHELSLFLNTQLRVQDTNAT